ncbi:hypothetical protein EXN66_Car018189 [Channa argus]|uniref:Uncharacterized protein n=1 Tax=Channa argus TaxID=215402 RepID=A0A6G1QIK1_CHAAH|nr:hypothetical protein EXN66_Car018189 [Channa argus]
MEEPNKAVCPFVLAGCEASDHPSLSEANISGTHSALLPFRSCHRLCLTGTSSAKWSLYTALTETISISTSHAGQSGRATMIFFFAASQVQVNGRMEKPVIKISMSLSFVCVFDTSSDFTLCKCAYLHTLLSSCCFCESIIKALNPCDNVYPMLNISLRAHSAAGK